MPRYRTNFERINFGVNPPLKQTADVLFVTDVPFDDKNIDAFTQAAWTACYEQNPHWQDPKGPTGVNSGWSSVLGGYTFTKIDEDLNTCVIWHVASESWLKQDGVSFTEDVEEAGKFSQDELATLRKQHNGPRYPSLVPKFWKEVLAEKASTENDFKLELVEDEFVLWGYGDLVYGDYLHVDRARTHITDDFSIDFELPKEGNHMGEPREFQRRMSWAWRFTNGSGGNNWKLANSKEAALDDAKEVALKNMRSTGYRNCLQWLAYKNIAPSAEMA